MKKLIVTLCLLCVFSFTASAFNITDLTPSNEFIVHSDNSADVAKILETSESALAEKVADNGIIFLAVNEKNTKQIQMTCNETDFSNKVSNLSNLSNDSINTLLPDITGLENVKGEVVYKDTQKYVKINLRNDNDQYILTQFFTVMDKKMYVLSFYTSASENTDYIEKTFSTASYVETETETDSKLDIVRIIIICGTFIFGSICAVLIFTVIKDIFIKKKNEN